MLPLCHLWTPSSQPSSKPMVLIWALSPWRLQWTYRGFLCQWWMPFTEPSFEYICSDSWYQLSDVSPRKPEETCKGSPVSVRVALYKTIFWVAFHKHSMKSVFQEKWTNVQKAPFVVMNVLFKTIFQLSLSSSFNEFCLLEDLSKCTVASKCQW